jgi:hypothetical protein
MGKIIQSLLESFYHPTQTPILLGIGFEAKVFLEKLCRELGSTHTFTRCCQLLRRLGIGD